VEQKLIRENLSPDDVASLKEIMNYRIEQPKSCQVCRHSKVVAGFIDRSWDAICNRPCAIGLPGLPVDHSGVCDHFERRA